MTKADKDYVLNGSIYLTGAEMPEGWEKPPAPKQDPGVQMFGPHGVMADLPGLPLPAGVTAPAAPEDMAFEELVQKLQARGLRIEPMPTKDDLVEQLTQATAGEVTAEEVDTLVEPEEA